MILHDCEFEIEAKALILAIVDKSYKVGFCYPLSILLYMQLL